jgi:L-rhamnose isomerase/sugar isomerase
VGCIKPYQLFLIFSELVDGMDVRGMDHARDLGWMIDASHNVKDPLEDLLQSVEAIQLTYAQALLVDRRQLKAAQEANDVVAAQEILQGAFRTDVRPLVAEARLRAGGALDPLALYRSEQVRKRLIKERGASGSPQAYECHRRIRRGEDEQEVIPVRRAVPYRRGAIGESFSGDG